MPERAELHGILFLVAYHALLSRSGKADGNALVAFSPADLQVLAAQARTAADAGVDALLGPAA